MNDKEKRKANNACHKRRYWEWREQGLCGHCGKRWAEAGHSKCRVCRLSAEKSASRPDAKEALKEYKQNIKAERREKGQCTNCGRKLKPEELGVNTRCSVCRAKIREATNVRRLRMRIHGIKRKR